MIILVLLTKIEIKNTSYLLKKVIVLVNTYKFKVIKKIELNTSEENHFKLI